MESVNLDLAGDDPKMLRAAELARELVTARIEARGDPALFNATVGGIVREIGSDLEMWVGFSVALSHFTVIVLGVAAHHAGATISDVLLSAIEALNAEGRAF